MTRAIFAILAVFYALVFVLGVRDYVEGWMQ